MIETTKEAWISKLKPCDLVIIRGKTLFAKLQKIDARMDGNKKYLASHSAMITDPLPHIFEADGLRGVIKKYQISRYLTDHHQIWIWRFDMDDEQREDMLEYMEDVIGMDYGWAGIMQFVKSAYYHVIGKTYDPKDKRGMFCSEATGRAILRGKLPYIQSMEPEDVSPSEQLAWMNTWGPTLAWYNPLAYDKGIYYIT